MAEIKVTGYRCDKCGHEWISKLPQGPILCTHPKCRTANWNAVAIAEKRESYSA